ncbi:MAG: gluconokinase [Gemmatirosa sp.]|nr:gluconokinase [Gemmatirosa sp.]
MRAPQRPLDAGASPDRAGRPAVVVLMGVAGAGKTTVGQRLAASLGWSFADADAFHPPENVERMRRGAALTDDDRRPWLDALRAHVGAALARHEHLVLACSALRRVYREALVPAEATPDAVRFVHLAVSPAELARRLATRPGHFAPPALLGSQLATLEDPTPDEHVPVVDGELPVDAVVERIRAALGV